jgi:hypothetical protein
MKRTIQIILAVLALARFVGAQVMVPGPVVLGPTTQPVPVDASAAVAAVQQLAASANAQLATDNSQLETLRQQLAAAQSQLATGNSQRATRGQAKPWLLANDEKNDWSYVTRWADQAHSASGFYDVSNGAQPFTYSGNGYPIGANIHARSMLSMLGAPAGDYAVTWQGNATLSISGLGGVAFKSTGPNSGILTLPAEGTLVQTQWGPNPAEQVLIDVTSSDPANPLDQLHVWTPGYGPGSAHAGQMYLDAYLALVKAYGGVRTMPSSNACFSNEVNWSDGVQLSQWDWTSKGVPIEAEIELVKEAGLSTWWVNVPAKANQDSRQREAKLIHDSLPRTTLIVEWGNEPWNSMGGFVANLVCTNPPNPADYKGSIVNGKLTNDGADVGGYVRAARVAFDQARECALDFVAAYADRPGMCLPAFNCQSGNVFWASSAYAWANARYGSAEPFRILAIAPYVDFWANNGRFCKPTGANGTFVLSDLFTACDAFLNDATAANDGWEYQVQQHVAIAKANNEECDAYEIGQHFFPQLVNNAYTGVDLSTQAQTDPRMGFLYDDLYARCHRDGIRRACSFALIGSQWSKDGFWSLLRSYEEVNSAAAYRWQADRRESRRSN